MVKGIGESSDKGFFFGGGGGGEAGGKPTYLSLSQPPLHPLVTTFTDVC